MKLTVLGKYGPFPACGGATSGYLFQHENINIMLDYGCGINGRIDEYIAPENLDTIILSHTHFDHASDLLVLSYRIKKPIKLYMPKSKDGDLADAIINTNAYDITYYDEDTSFSMGDLSFSFCKGIHPFTSYSLKIKSSDKTFVYTGDTVYTDELVAFCKGSNLVLADAMQREDVKNPHMTVLEASNIHKLSGATVLCSHAPATNAGDPTKYEGLIEAEEFTSYTL
ncbi:MAG: MBL fold metallo-hydrolase [Clostridiales bacterium]|nr:MBL fold metallo-hydrolase [Clostridiales bacterium]